MVVREDRQFPMASVCRVQNRGSRAVDFAAPSLDEEERPDAEAVNLCPLSYVRSFPWEALFAAFGWSTLRTTR